MALNLLDNKMNELQMQARCWQWYRNKYHDKRLRRIKNELDNHPKKTKRDIIVQLSENASTGIIKGTPDFMFISNPMVWIEMKLEDGVQSPEQIEFESLCYDFGHQYFLVYSEQEFQKLINEIH